MVDTSVVSEEVHRAYSGAFGLGERSISRPKHKKRGGGSGVVLSLCMAVVVWP